MVTEPMIRFWLPSLMLMVVARPLMVDHPLLVDHLPLEDRPQLLVDRLQLEDRLLLVDQLPLVVHLQQVQLQLVAVSVNIAQPLSSKQKFDFPF